MQKAHSLLDLQKMFDSPAGFHMMDVQGCYGRRDLIPPVMLIIYGKQFLDLILKVSHVMIPNRCFYSDSGDIAEQRYYDSNSNYRQ